MITKKSNVDSYARTMSVRWLAMCALPMLIVFVFNYLPMFGAIIAFKDYKYNLGILGSPWVGFENFKFFFESDVFFRITWNTLKFNLIFIIGSTVCAILIALFLYQISGRGRTKVFQTILITPHFMSWVVAASMAYAILQPAGGFLNTILTSMGLKAVNWYGEPKAWTPILTIAYLWKTVGMDSIMYYAALMGIDSTYFEAASIDGAGRFKTMRSIILPCLIPLVLTLTILKVGNIFRADFGLFYQLPRNVGTLYEATDVVDTYIYRSMREVGDMGMSSAIGLLQSVVGFVMVMMTNKISKKIDADSGLF